MAAWIFQVCKNSAILINKNLPKGRNFTYQEDPDTYEFSEVVYGCFLKWWYPQVINFDRVFHINHTFWGTTIFGNLHINLQFHPLRHPNLPGVAMHPQHSRFFHFTLSSLAGERNDLLDAQDIWEAVADG